MLQKTIEKSVYCSGIGLHSGKKVHLGFHPAPVDSGISFAVKTSGGKKFINPGPSDIIDTSFATTIAKNGCKVSTVEHLLAAVRGMDLDNLTIEVGGDEIPIMDGSAASYVFLINQAGICRQNKSKKILALKSEFFLQEDGKWIKGYPSDNFRVDYNIDFPHPLVGEQSFSFMLDTQNFVDSLCKARTFGFIKDVEHLQNNGLIQGGSLENAVVLDDSGVVNPEGMRFEDEPVRHKVLDFIGDMGLMQLQIRGHFEVYCSGHALNANYLYNLEKNKDSVLELIDMEGQGLNKDEVVGKDVQGVPAEVLAG